MAARTGAASGVCPSRRPDVHPFYVATQAHPEFKSRPTKPHPLFAGLVKAALQHQEER